MVYERSLRKTGEVLILGSVAFHLIGVEGCGGSSVVYQALYQDSLNKDQMHRVLIKELFPWHPKGAVFRDERGNIRCRPEGRDLMAASRRRYREGNQVNLELLKANPTCISGNLNSYEAYGTYYTVLSFHGGESLASILERQTKPFSLWEMLVQFMKILDALEHFHKNSLLYLDISPENILILPEQALFIDYNSVWHMDEILSGEYMFGECEGYSASEVRMQDRENISFASDTYSLCAVFYRMLTGKVLTEKEIIGNNLRKCLSENLPVFEKIPKTAVYKVAQILTRGLYILPHRRYQTVEALRADVRELMCRINGSGVSHSAIWESSRSLCRKQEGMSSPYLIQMLLADDGSILQIPRLFELLERGKSFLLTGSGGIGKTRLLKEMWKQRTLSYTPDRPVVYYIPLKDYQERGGEYGYIRNYILCHLRCGGNGESVKDALHRLEQLFSRRTGGSVSLILLLDGLNEAGSHREKLLREIEGLEKKEGVSLLVTERYGEVKEYSLREFQSVELQMLLQETVREELEVRKLTWPVESRLQELLRIPIMLELYEQAGLLEMEAGNATGPEPSVPVIRTPEDLAERYLQQLLLYQLRIDSGNEAAQLCHRYILKHLLPSIALKMEEKDSTLLNFDELFELVGESYRRLKEEAFGRSFRCYLGKSRKMLENIENEAE